VEVEEEEEEVDEAVRDDDIAELDDTVVCEAEELVKDDRDVEEEVEL
jgi:hypothetical protein